MGGDAVSALTPTLSRGAGEGGNWRASSHVRARAVAYGTQVTSVAKVPSPRLRGEG